MAELGNHFFGHAVAEVILPGISGEIGERQNRQHDSALRVGTHIAGVWPQEVSGHRNAQKGSAAQQDEP